jgi:16S rRNA (guanine966-N2)-methyltransferase
MARYVRQPRTSSRKGPAGSFRIIGGEWRGRRLPVPAEPGVRPTPDRVRETLFNWLAPLISGARCLDLYTGSGALGLEALSRGAGRVVFVDRTPAVLHHVTANLAKLKSDRGEAICMDAQRYLERPATPFDIVFLDPPYGQGLLEPVAERLFAGGWLSPAGTVYLEHEAEAPPPALPAGWQLYRSASAGRVRYHLARPAPAIAEDA